MSIRPPHTEFSRLIDLGEGRLSSVERNEVMTHISTCHTCAERLAKIEKTINLMRSDDSEDAPRHAIAGAVSLLRLHKPAPSGLRRILASLSFDSFTTAPAFGIRAAATEERQLVFIAGDNEIQLQIAPADKKWKVYGQVLGPCSGGEVEVTGAAGSQKLPLDELCEFSLPPMSSGDYVLSLLLQDVEVEIPALKLGV